ncbi:1-(5-phosphoribosyl)-5-[(5-phosphoribosylamino)methylideneamino]imidazole-4-carboxamide isomerase [Flavobacterium aurantiibacter]|uniref:1-(5-phosphoribosyl)-5-[(5-phosphoribosylamino)methylideneamino] imidazole-4-carboxamide isomerase n=1 Tax=Flavobacterium aurantiibacter TaxID=2023067 RepID=A0A255ZTF9_9FLAO|nr:1-(5-phosphoribosyl)-5-[(5-phosphoribosylamino)methylideneamino]imidazole-4-carboxamide isomerase [Flavobacterium aurantiibacter]OYQ44847.1 1-(5-phosphoribosyl)-5-[(5-phosphoribosylamino)methylideneamino]imidazole-4-carboxamide isomerase [Flavobacterium aurantiibacter]
MRIIPAIDIIEGKCVRLTKGDYSTQKIYRENPLEVAKEFEANGIEYLHLVDLDGAKSNGIVNYKTLELLATKTQLKIDFGGGIKSTTDVEIAFSSGAAQITAGSIAVKKPELFASWLDRYGSSKIILGADAQNRKIAVQGWLEKSDEDVVSFIKTHFEKGIQYVVCTDIEKDGMLAGPSFNLYHEILKSVPVKLVASGGVSSLNDLQQLKTLGCDAAIIGKALYENKITLTELAALC